MAGGQRGQGFRRQPPDVSSSDTVARPQLIAALSKRFDHRLTLLVGPAGAGKTTTLALALEANRMDRRGRDVWVAADVHDLNSGALMSSIAQTLEAPLGADDVTAIADAVWAQAPDDVTIVIDDVHHLIGSPAEAEVASLLHALPDNGHLLLAGRARLDIPVARLRAQDELVEISEADLLLDDAELAELADRHQRDHAFDLEQSPRVAGLAALTLRFGRAAGTEFLWEEVLASLEPRHLDVLRVLALFDEFDDRVLTAVGGAASDMVVLLASLPLVDRDVTGGQRFHSLLREALSTGLSNDELADLQRRAGEFAVTVGDRATAVKLFSRSGDVERSMETARSFVLGSTLRRTLRQLRIVSDAVTGADPDSGLALLLQCEVGHGQIDRDTSHDALARDLRRAATLACEAGDEWTESAALYRSVQTQVQQTGTYDVGMVDRLDELAESVPYAQQVVRYARAITLLGSDGSDAALAEITPLDDPWDPISEEVFHAGMLCNVGRYEDVDLGFKANSSETVTPAALTYHGYASYFRGDVLPEVAVTVHDETSFGLSASRIVSPVITSSCVRALMGVQAGDAEVAHRAIAISEQAATWGCAAAVRAHIDAARAASAMVFESEEEATRLMSEMLDAVPMRRWPTPAHFTVLDLVYLLSPESRERIDRCRFGVAPSVAVEAAKAVLEVREHAMSDRLRALPWSNHGLMRVQVSAPLLAELGACAHEAGIDGARELIATIPGAERQLRRVAASGEASAPAASALLQDWPTPPLSAIRVHLLGGLAVFRDGERIEHPDLDRRARVQELLALLAERRRISRVQVCEALWPDLDAKKAAANLRVTLAYLNRALEPERAGEAEPLCVRASGEMLLLHDSIEIDVDDFDRAIREATKHDRSNSPRAALEGYRAAVALVPGGYLEQMDAAWMWANRERVQFAVVNAFLRIGELTLARGEPEEALEWALRARRWAPAHDRAERLNARCRIATGDRSGAVRTLRSHRDALIELGLSPETESERLLTQIVDQS